MPLVRKPEKQAQDDSSDRPLVFSDLPLLFGLSVLFPIVILWITGFGASEAGALVRIVFAIPYLVLFPGYALIATLFPARDSLTSLERFGLSVGLSISVVAFSGYGLNFTPWGIRLAPLCVVLTALNILFCGLALYQRSRLPPEKRFTFTIRLRKPVWVLPDRKGMVLWTVLVCAVLSTVAALVYGVATTGPQERYTEFFILSPDPEHLASPDPIFLGNPITVVLGVVNHEHKPVSYSILIRDCGSKRQVINLQLNHDQHWEEPVTIVPTISKEDCNISFLLFREGDTEPYRSLFFWITVIPAATETVLFER